MAADLTILGLRVVQAVATHGSFTAAADALGYTQSAVSRQVAATEEAAGTPLFERLPRGVRPTSAGAVLLRHAARVLEDVDAAGQELRGLGDRLEGRLAVGAYPSALATLVPRALARVREEHPSLAVTLREGTSPTQLRRVRAGRLELAVVATGPGLPDDAGDLRGDVLAEGGLLLAVPHGHRLAERGRIDVRELATEAWIAGDRAQGDFAAWPTLTGARIAFSVRDWRARLGLVAAGLGLAVVPEMTAGAMPPGIALVGVDEAVPVRRTVLAVSRAERSAAAAALVAALRAEAGA